ncbi:MAG: hypothetical protein BGO28_02875 [Alphaproteobacteria bacterium 43-37]|nr:MAG: hypothetical protein BGO28_02875 [Alphaproteobacteria bacterium 43-37]
MLLLLSCPLYSSLFGTELMNLYKDDRHLLLSSRAADPGSRLFMGPRFREGASMKSVKHNLGCSAIIHSF